jgi:hypothetical protein
LGYFAKYKVFSSMNERSYCELLLAHLRQRREEMASAAVSIQGEQLEETVPRVQGLYVSSVKVQEALQSIHSHERRGADGVGLSAPISTAEFIDMSGRVRSPRAAPLSQDWEIVQGANVVQGVRRGSSVLPYISEAMHQFVLAASASGVIV